MIYTSNYARKGSHPHAIAISQRPPSWFTGQHAIAFAPGWDLVMGIKGGDITQEEYTERYTRLLNVHASKIINKEWVEALPDSTFFLCYESPTDFCHRHIFSKWVEERTGIVIPEWLNEKELAALQEKEKRDKLVDDLLTF